MSGDTTANRGGRARGSWNQAEPRELRRPYNQQTADNTKVGETPKYTLSAEAKEWYPPNYQPATNTYTSNLSYQNAEPAANYRPARFSVQDRLRVNQEQDAFNVDDLANNLPGDIENEHLKDCITHLINVMCEVTFCPGKFDNLCGPLVDTFASYLHDISYTSPLVDAIVNQSIYEPNFRYNGARLCSMYDSLAPPEESTFRSCLLERCTAEENKIITGVETREENRRGFAMFLAEIYTQLEDMQGGRIRSLGESLCKILLYLLETEETNNIKSVCQLLKLSGIALDADCPAGMHIAFERLRLLQNIPIVKNILQLRSTRWGVQEPTLPRAVSNGGIESPKHDTIYMTDGHSLTAEERDFLQSHLPANALADDEDDYDQDWEPGMDADMRAGFIEFLKMSNQIKR